MGIAPGPKKNITKNTQLMKVSCFFFIYLRIICFLVEAVEARERMKEQTNAHYVAQLLTGTYLHTFYEARGRGAKRDDNSIHTQITRFHSTRQLIREAGGFLLLPFISHIFLPLLLMRLSDLT